MLCTKGAGWLFHYEFMANKFQPHELERVKQSLSEEDRQVLFDKPILPITRLPLKPVVNYLIAADKLLGKGDYKVYQDCLRYKAQKELRGIYKVFASLMSPHQVLKKSSTLWKHIYTEGMATSEPLGPNEGLVKIEQAHGLHALYYIAVIAYTEEALRITGARNPKGMLVNQGDDHITLKYTWE